MENNTDFDALARESFRMTATEDLDPLFRAAFALPEWHFIRRGEAPNFYPYIASNRGFAANQPMIRAFTDSARLLRFARENNLTEADGSCPTLTIPTENASDYLEQFAAHGAFGVWFNSDSESDGFYIPIGRLRTIKERFDTPPPLETAAARKPAMKTGILIIQDGLGFPSGFVSEANYKLNIFFHVPAEWTDGERLGTDAQEKIFEFLYGAGWRNGNDDGSRYVVIDSFATVFDEETVKNTRWEGTTDTREIHYRFYLASADGTIRSVKEAEFQAEIFAGAEN